MHGEGTVTGAPLANSEGEITAHRNGGGGFDFAQSCRGIDALNAGKVHQYIENEVLIPVHRPGLDLHQEIALAKDGITLLDFRRDLDLVDQIVPLFFGESPHLHEGEDVEIEAELLPIKDRHLALDIPFLAKPLQASPARRLGQTDNFGQFYRGKAAIFLQLIQDFDIKNRKFFAHGS